ncbi:MAG: tetratricopeptide repeat protein [bacterium]|nr:tetratricopeptide repeat protein [Gammaproteobacteria bacterium]
MSRNISGYWYLLLFACLASPSLFAESRFVGAQKCVSCHKEVAAQWAQSDHSKAMLVADENSVKGNFTGETIEFHGISSRFFRRGDDYLVETVGVETAGEYNISYTFGHYPLQQYLVETTEGHLQALNIAWDSRVAEDGGQRWIHLQPNEDITPESPFFWTRHLQNWNSRCAVCHSTNLQKNYSVENNSYATTWSDINVACEACHGPGDTHVERAAGGNFQSGSGLVNAPNTLVWEFVQGQSIAQPKGEKSNRHINMCGGCHSRRTKIGVPDPGVDYHSQFRLALLSGDLYYPDGQIREEDYVLGSFLQSKMHARGVTCSNCHEPHSSKLILQGNNLCSQCHLPTVYNTKKHHFHPEGSSGAECVECHMPETTYMLVDDRRDHRFGIPAPGTSELLGVPNACNQCHKGTKPTWAKKVIDEHFIDPPLQDPFAKINSLAQRGDPTVTRPILTLAGYDHIPPIMKATLIERLADFPSRVSNEAALGYLANSDPLIRRVAVRNFQSAAPLDRWKALRPLIDDPVKSVRREVAIVLSNMQSDIPLDKIGLFYKIIDEYRETLALMNDMPSTQAELGNLELNLGNLGGAETAYRQALVIEPLYVPALMNLADLYRATNEEAKAKPLLDKALSFAPDSAAVNYSYALSLIRQQKYEEALPLLKASTELADSQARYAYVYAVALDAVERTADAVSYLEGAIKTWPNQYDLLMTQVLYMEKLGQTENILVPLSELSKLAPNAPEVRRRVNQYIR